MMRLRVETSALVAEEWEVVVFNGVRENAKLGRSSRPFFYGDYRNSANGFECWKTQDVPTNAAWRLRQDLDGTCY